MKSKDINNERNVLNVGGYSKSHLIPHIFSSWRHDLLDIDPSVKPDILCDARELWRLPPRDYDAIFCSHNLEHYYYHDLPKVLKGFNLVLKKDGFLYIVVPDIMAAMKAVLEEGKDFEDELYEVAGNNILVRDLFYGSHIIIEKCNSDFMLHKNGFTESSLKKTLINNGFGYIHTQCSDYNLYAIAFKEKPAKWQLELLNISS